MKNILTMNNGERYSLTEDQMAAVANQHAERSAQISIKVGRDVHRFPWSKIDSMDTLHPTACGDCGADTYPGESHYCKFPSLSEALDSDPGVIPEYSEAAINEIRTRINPPKGDLHYIAHLERMTRLKAIGGRTYYRQSPEKEKLRERVKAMKKSIRSF